MDDDSDSEIDTDADEEEEETETEKEEVSEREDPVTLTLQSSVKRKINDDICVSQPPKKKHQHVVSVTRRVTTAALAEKLK